MNLLHHFAVEITSLRACVASEGSLPDARAVSWQDLEVERAHDGRPSLKLLGLAAELAAKHGPFDIQLSLSHSDRPAGAVAVLVRGRET